ncbi:helix-turn-helix domain-containing protein [Phormidesmis priestleyi]|uniref:helix-turn-helix domain-containing protein n=1 Tax=Phormidesmis priestleyi TaxID=268141 RepID=UPI00083B6305|nr:helix-turn-helix transcriptional regulator [Phormidesmis priestleyi]
MTGITFGHFVADARKKLNMTQKELAASIMREDGSPISPQYLNDIERDRRSPSSDHLVQQFAKVLELSADYLHYLNGRFPEQERQEQLTEDQFSKRMLAFRKGKEAK